MLGRACALAATVAAGALVVSADLQVQITCGMGFDSYIILDHSASVGNRWENNIIPMIYNYVETFKKMEDFRLAVEVFGTGTVESLPLTPYYKKGTDIVLDDINTTLSNMRTSSGKGSTHGERAMESVYYQITAQPRLNNKIIWFVTDGLNYGPDIETIYWANKIRDEYGGTIFALAVEIEQVAGGAVDSTVLKMIANKCTSNCTYQANQYFIPVSDFNILNQIFSSVRDSFVCSKVTNLGIAANICPPFKGDIPITGSGFATFAIPGDDEATGKQMSCRYWREPKPGEVEGRKAVEVPVIYKGPTSLLCRTHPDYPIDFTTTVEVRLTPTGEYTNSQINVNMYRNDDPHCVPPPFPYWIFAIIVPVVLFLLWWFFPLLPQKKKQETIQEEVIQSPEIMATIVAPLTPTAPALPPPSLPPPKTKKRVRKWAKVDTTHYIWARDGGTARPMECNWGTTGAPESAPTKKGDMVYEVQQEAPPEIQEPAVTFSTPVMPAPVPVVNPEPAEGDFEDLEWDRCCGGACKSASCAPCKACMSRMFTFSAFLGKTISQICFAVCRPCTPCLRCYQWCDSKRPRPNCCGVSRDADAGKKATGGGGATEMAGAKKAGGGVKPLPPGWEELRSDNGDVYFYNEKTDTSQWTRPE